MRKNLKWFSIPLMVALAALTLTARVQAAVTVKGITVDPKWIGFTFRGSDSYYGADVIAYKENSLVVLSVSIYNDFTDVPNKPINVSAVKISFDWKNGTYRAPESLVNLTSPIVIPWHETRTVTFNFTIPSTTVATNLYLHSYTITVEHRNYPSQVKYDDVTLFAADFAVYSTVQADGIELSKIINSITKPTFTSTRANILWLKSDNETATAWRYYDKGDFSTAKAHFQTALDYRSQAYVAEETYGVAKEELDLKVDESIINMNNSIGTFMVLFGAALVLFAIGYIIRAFAVLRKPPAVPP